jgi:hypothetical protein
MKTIPHITFYQQNQLVKNKEFFMKIDISHFGMRVVLQNTGNQSYSAYPRDIEGTILSVYISRNREVKHIKDGNYRALFDIEDTIVKVSIRWDNDTRGVYSTINLHIRDFGRCPGLQSIWSNGCYSIDNRPYQELKPMTKARIRKGFYSKEFINIKLPISKLDDIDLSDIVEDMEPTEPPKPKKAKIKQRTYGSYNTYATMTTRSTKYVGTYGASISASSSTG